MTDPAKDPVTYNLHNGLYNLTVALENLEKRLAQVEYYAHQASKSLKR